MSLPQPFVPEDFRSWWCHVRWVQEELGTLVATLDGGDYGRLQTQLDRPKGKRGAAGAGPSVIVPCDAVTSDPGGAVLMGGVGLTREAGKGAEAFTARATAGASMAFRLLDNGRLHIHNLQTTKPKQQDTKGVQLGGCA